MSEGMATVSYIGATILFILSLGGLSNPETSRRGNLYGMIGMALAVVATVFGPRVSPAGIGWILGAMDRVGSWRNFAALVPDFTYGIGVRFECQERRRGCCKRSRCS